MPSAKTSRTTGAPASAAADANASPVATADLEPLIVANQKSLKAASEANGHLLKRLATLNTELSRFIERRLEQDRKTARELAACTTPPEAFAAYGRFFERAVKQYSDEMGLLAGLVSDQAREAMEDMQHQVENAMKAGTRTGGSG